MRKHICRQTTAGEGRVVRRVKGRYLRNATPETLNTLIDHQRADDSPRVDTSPHSTPSSSTTHSEVDFEDRGTLTIHSLISDRPLCPERRPSLPFTLSERISRLKTRSTKKLGKRSYRIESQRSVPISLYQGRPWEIWTLSQGSLLLRDKQTRCRDGSENVN